MPFCYPLRPPPIETKHPNNLFTLEGQPRSLDCSMSAPSPGQLRPNSAIYIGALEGGVLSTPPTTFEPLTSPGGTSRRGPHLPSPPHTNSTSGSAGERETSSQSGTRTKRATIELPAVTVMQNGEINEDFDDHKRYQEDDSDDRIHPRSSLADKNKEVCSLLDAIYFVLFADNLSDFFSPFFFPFACLRFAQIPRCSQPAIVTTTLPESFNFSFTTIDHCPTFCHRPETEFLPPVARFCPPIVTAPQASRQTRAIWNSGQRTSSRRNNVASLANNLVGTCIECLCSSSNDGDKLDASCEPQLPTTQESRKGRF